MSLTVAVQMDPIERIKIAGDSSFALMLEAQARPVFRRVSRACCDDAARGDEPCGSQRVAEEPVHRGVGQGRRERQYRQ